MITALRLVDWFRVSFHSIRLSFNWIIASYLFHSLYILYYSIYAYIPELERDFIGHEQKYTLFYFNLLNILKNHSFFNAYF